jgi:hypothetical protein
MAPGEFAGGFALNNSSDRKLAIADCKFQIEPLAACDFAMPRQKATIGVPLLKLKFAVANLK